MDAGFAWGIQVLEGGFGRDGQNLPGGIETDDAFKGRDGILAVGRNEFRNLVLRHALFLKGCVGQLLSNVVGHFNNESDRIRHAGLLHPLHHVRSVVVQQMTTELFGLLGNAFGHDIVRCG